MNCPICKHPMIVLEIADIEIDHCIKCRGVWLDSGELELLLADAVNRNQLMEILSQEVEGKEKTIRCPICDKKLEKVVHGTDHGSVCLDKCPADDGLWFDRGELIDMIKLGEFYEDSKIVGLLHEVFGH